MENFNTEIKKKSTSKSRKHFHALPKKKPPRLFFNLPVYYTLSTNLPLHRPISIFTQLFDFQA